MTLQQILDLRHNSLMSIHSIYVHVASGRELDCQATDVLTAAAVAHDAACRELDLIHDRRLDKASYSLASFALDKLSAALDQPNPSRDKLLSVKTYLEKIRQNGGGH